MKGRNRHLHSARHKKTIIYRKDRTRHLYTGKTDLGNYVQERQNQTLIYREERNRRLFTRRAETDNCIQEI